MHLDMYCRNASSVIGQSGITLALHNLKQRRVTTTSVLGSKQEPRDCTGRCVFPEPCRRRRRLFRVFVVMLSGAMTSGLQVWLACFPKASLHNSRLSALFTLYPSLFPRACSAIAAFPCDPTPRRHTAAAPAPHQSGAQCQDRPERRALRRTRSN